MTVLGPKVLADILVSTSEIDVYILVPVEMGSVPGVPKLRKFGQVPTKIFRRLN